MASSLSSYRDFPTAFALVTAAALAFTGLIATTSPAHAMVGSTDYRCTALSTQAQTAADGTASDKQASAKRFVSLGNKLCDAGNERAAAKQFRAALKLAGVAEVDSDSRMAAR